MEPEVSKITTTRFKYVRDDPANEKLQRARQYNSYYEALPKKEHTKKEKETRKKRGIRSMSALRSTDIHSLQRSLITPRSKEHQVHTSYCSASRPPDFVVSATKQTAQGECSSVQAGSLVTVLSNWGPAGPCPKPNPQRASSVIPSGWISPCYWQGLTCRHLEPNQSAWESSFWSYDHPPSADSHSGLAPWPKP